MQESGLNVKALLANVLLMMIAAFCCVWPAYDKWMLCSHALTCCGSGSLGGAHDGGGRDLRPRQHHARCGAAHSPCWCAQALHITEGLVGMLLKLACIRGPQRPF